MSAKGIEKLVWLLIYAGLILFSLGWFVREPLPALGWTMKLVGGIGVVAGAVLIWVRSRWPR